MTEGDWEHAGMRAREQESARAEWHRGYESMTAYEHDAMPAGYQDLMGEREHKNIRARYQESLMPRYHCRSDTKLQNGRGK